MDAGINVRRNINEQYSSVGLGRLALAAIWLFVSMALLSPAQAGLVTPESTTYTAAPPVAPGSLIVLEGVSFLEAYRNSANILDVRTIDWANFTTEWMRFTPELDPTPPLQSPNKYNAGSQDRSMSGSFTDDFAYGSLYSGVDFSVDLKALENKIAAKEVVRNTLLPLKDSPYIFQQSNITPQHQNESIVMDYMVLWLVDKVTDGWSYTNIFLIAFVLLTLSTVMKIIRKTRV